MATGFLIKIGVYIHGMAPGGIFNKKRTISRRIGIHARTSRIVPLATINGGLVEPVAQIVVFIVSHIGDDITNKLSIRYLAIKTFNNQV